MVFNGRLSTTDRATGKPAACIFSACLPNARCSRIWFLAAVESAARLTRLNALVSPNPYDLEAVEPFPQFKRHICACSHGPWMSLASLWRHALMDSVSPRVPSCVLCAPPTPASRTRNAVTPTVEDR